MAQAYRVTHLNRYLTGTIQFSIYTKKLNVLLKEEGNSKQILTYFRHSTTEWIFPRNPYHYRLVWYHCICWRSNVYINSLNSLWKRKCRNAKPKKFRKSTLLSWVWHACIRRNLTRQLIHFKQWQYIQTHYMYFLCKPQVWFTLFFLHLRNFLAVKYDAETYREIIVSHRDKLSWISWISQAKDSRVNENIS